MSTGPGCAACLQDARARSNTRGCITMGAACVGRYTAVCLVLFVSDLDLVRIMPMLRAINAPMLCCLFYACSSKASWNNQTRWWSQTFFSIGILWGRASTHGHGHGHGGILGSAWHVHDKIGKQQEGRKDPSCPAAHPACFPQLFGLAAQPTGMPDAMVPLPLRPAGGSSL